MISKEEFIHKVEKERQIWKKIQEEEDSRPKPKNRKRDILLSPLFFVLYIFGGFQLLKSTSNETIKLLIVGAIFISFFLFPFLSRDKEDNFSKTRQEHYEKMLSLLGVKKNFGKRFYKFPSTPYSNPAYQITNLVVQHFTGWPYTGGKSHCRTVSNVMIFFEKNNKGKSRGFQKLYHFKKDNPIRQIGEQFYDFFKMELCSGYQKENEHQIKLGYVWAYHGWGNECPFCFLKKTTPHDLLVSDNYKFCCDKIYEEIMFFNKISKMIDEI